MDIFSSSLNVSDCPKSSESSWILRAFIQLSQQTNLLVKVVKVSKKAVGAVQRDYFRERMTVTFQSRACLSPHLILTFPLALTPSRAELSLLWQGPKKREELLSVGASPQGLTVWAPLLSETFKTFHTQILKNKKGSISSGDAVSMFCFVSAALMFFCELICFLRLACSPLIIPYAEGPAKSNHVDTQLCFCGTVDWFRQEHPTCAGPESFPCNLELALRF